MLNKRIFGIQRTTGSTVPIFTIVDKQQSDCALFQININQLFVSKQANISGSSNCDNFQIYICFQAKLDLHEKGFEKFIKN